MPATESSRPSAPATNASSTLGQQLPDDLPAAGADRDAHAHLARPPRGAREQEVGDVGTGNQQDEADRAQQRPEQQPDLRSDDQTLERIGIRRELLVGVGILAGECACRSRSARPRACSSVTPPLSRPMTK